MTVTTVGVFSGRVLSVVHPTKIGELSFPENVVILNSAEVDELKIVAIDHLHNVFFRNAKSGDSHHQFGLREKRDRASNFRWGLRISHNYGLTALDDGSAEYDHRHIVSWRLPIVFAHARPSLFLRIAEVFEVARI